MVHQSVGKFKANLPDMVGNDANDLIPMMRRLLTDLFEDLQRTDHRIATVTRGIEAIAAPD